MFEKLQRNFEANFKELSDSLKIKSQEWKPSQKNKLGMNYDQTKNLEVKEVPPND